MKTNQKAKMYFGGIKIRCTIENGDNSYSMTFNTLKSYKEILNDYHYDMYDNIELIKDNLILYHCTYYNPNNLQELTNIRNNISRKLTYDTFLTKEEIIDLLNKNYIVCVEYLKEIDLNQAEKL